MSMSVKEQAEQMNQHLRSEYFASTVYYVQRATKYAGKRVFVLKAGETEQQTIDPENWNAADGIKLTAKEFDTEHAERNHYRTSVNRLIDHMLQFEADASTPETVASAAPDAAQAEPVADADIPFAEGMDDSEPVASEPACDWCKSTDNVSMRYYRGAAVMQVCEDCMPSQDTVDPQGEGVFKDGDSLIGQANIWTHNADDMPRPVVTDKWRYIHQSAWLFTERTGVTGHGRTSRNRAKTGQNKAKGSRKVSTVMMERNAAKQAEIRAKYAAQHGIRYPNLMSINPRFWKMVMDTVNDMPRRKAA